MKHLINLLAVVFLILPQFSQAQCIKGNCWNGHGAYIYPSGAKYEGNFKDGKIQGKGILYFSDGNKYIGDWVDHYREGKGKMIFTSGDVYQGDFRHSRINGKGIMEFVNGDRYEGNWTDDRQHGFGKYFYSDGDHYEGAFYAGKLHGQGSMFYKDGSKYVGSWKSNQKDGKGKFFKTNGTEIEGTWINGKYQKKQNQNTYQNNSQLAEEVLRNCNTVFCDNGKGKYTYRDNSQWIGQFKNGVPEGKGTCFYSNGDKYVGNWKDHGPHGEGILYYTSGRILAAVWDYGKPVGDLDEGEDNIGQEYVKVDQDDEVKVWAVVVGIGRYTTMPVLKYTDDDAYHIYAFLKSPEGGALPDNQIRLLIDEDATRTNIIRAMRHLFLKADKNDVVLLYYSGHGVQGAFLPVDFDGYNNKLKHDELKALFTETKAKHKICLADACHAGTLTAMRAPDQTIQNYYKAFQDSEGGTALLLSSKGDEFSLEDQGLRQGIFSHYLIRGLKGEADINRNKIVTIQELFDFVYNKVVTYTANAQTPTITGSYDKNMPVAAIR